MGQDQDDTVIVPYTTVQKKLLGVQHVIGITISAADGVSLDDGLEPDLDAAPRAAPAGGGDGRRLHGAHAGGDGDDADVDDRTR